MRKRFSMIVIGVFLALTLVAGTLGCATFCKNAPSVATNLQSTVDVLKAEVAQLQGVLVNGYDAEIEAAYLAAKTALAAAQMLLKQWCPDPAAVADAVKNADTNVKLKVNQAMTRAAKLGLVK